MIPFDLFSLLIFFWHSYNQSLTDPVGFCILQKMKIFIIRSLKGETKLLSVLPKESNAGFYFRPTERKIISTALLNFPFQSCLFTSPTAQKPRASQDKTGSALSRLMSWYVNIRNKLCWHNSMEVSSLLFGKIWDTEVKACVAAEEKVGGPSGPTSSLDNLFFHRRWKRSTPLTLPLLHAHRWFVLRVCGDAGYSYQSSILVCWGQAALNSPMAWKVWWFWPARCRGFLLLHSLFLVPHSIVSTLEVQLLNAEYYDMGLVGASVPHWTLFPGLCYSSSAVFPKCLWFNAIAMWFLEYFYQNRQK